MLALGDSSAVGFIDRVTRQGFDLTERPFDFSNGSTEIRDLEILLTRARTDVSGVAQDERGEPRPEFVAVIFTEDETLWTARGRTIVAVRPVQGSRFVVEGLPAGTYRAIVKHA